VGDDADDAPAIADGDDEDAEVDEDLPEAAGLFR
jgi:hypothetical protein